MRLTHKGVEINHRKRAAISPHPPICSGSPVFVRSTTPFASRKRCAGWRLGAGA